MSNGAPLPFRVFVDTGALFALFNQRDAHHADAEFILTRDRRVRRSFITSNFVVAETHALMLRRAGREPAFQFLQGILSSATVIERVTEDDEERTLAILMQYDDKDFSYTDATSFAVMERLNIDTAFAFDRHFAQYGFRTLTAAQT